jgi:hypothetical protein
MVEQTFNPTWAGHLKWYWPAWPSLVYLRSRTGTGDDGKKSFCLDADPAGPQPGWSERNAAIMADTLKLIVKEGMTPDGADKVMFNLAPFIAMIVAMLLMAPIAFAKDFQIWDMNIGVLYVSAISSIWSSAF